MTAKAEALFILAEVRQVLRLSLSRIIDKYGIRLYLQSECIVTANLGLQQWEWESPVAQRCLSDNLNLVLSFLFVGSHYCKTLNPKTPLFYVGLLLRQRGHFTPMLELSPELLIVYRIECSLRRATINRCITGVKNA